MKPEDIMRLKELLPTSLGSDEVREQIAADILRRSVFSARMEYARHLAAIRDAVTQMLEGKIERGEAERLLLRSLAALGHSTEGESLTDPASERRLALILDTQCQMAESVARLSQQTEVVVSQFPGWELCRVGERRLPRKDWLARWNIAGQSVGWEGAVDHPIYGDELAYGFLALKSSPIWQALGDGVGGFRDTLGNPYPPFCYSSGMAWLDADRETCERFGLDVAAAAPRRASLSPAEADILEAARAVGFDNAFDDIIP